MRCWDVVLFWILVSFSSAFILMIDDAGSVAYWRYLGVMVDDMAMEFVRALHMGWC